MDILNWLYLAKNKFVRSTPSNNKDLMVFGSKVGTTKRGDLYQNYAMSIEDFAASLPASESNPFQTFLAQREADDVIDIVNAVEGTSIPDGASATYTKTIPLPFTAPTTVFGCLLASSYTPGTVSAGLKDPPMVLELLQAVVKEHILVQVVVPIILK